MLDERPLFARKLLLVTGKGGIGKTLVAAALAQRSAELGRKTLLVGSAARDQLSPLFGASATEAAPRQLAPNLECVNLHLSDNFRDYVVLYLGQKSLYDTVFSHKAVQSLMDMVPGLAELMLLGRLLYHAELAPSPRPDLIVFDAFASGHFLNLMTNPDAVLSSKVGGPLIRETERIKQLLSDSERTGILYTCVPEPLVISEALDFIPKLVKASPAKLLGVILNRMPLTTEPKSLPSAAEAYLLSRAEVAKDATEELIAGLLALEENGATLPTWMLPELGFVDEPLRQGFAEAWFRGETL